jgi:hypothetical protein
VRTWHPHLHHDLGALDHRANDPTRTLDITFALSFATNESRGILFYFVGGPGGSGLASADSYLAAFDPSLTENMDIVFVDQRGIGPVHGLACPRAQASFDIAAAPLSDPDAVLATARTYVQDCTAELGRPDLFPSSIPTRPSAIPRRSARRSAPRRSGSTAKATAASLSRPMPPNSPVPSAA